MNKEKAIETMWRNLEESVKNIQKELEYLRITISQRDGDGAGEIIKEMLRETLESYSRLAVIGALEEIE